MSRNYWDIGNDFSQPDNDTLKVYAAQSIKKAASKGKTMQPVKISGRQIAKNWWGKAWCENLEKYADFESRLERGKRYVRTGAVVDLVLQKGKVLAKVQGRRKTPYKVEIHISPLSEVRCQKIIESCETKIQSMDMLLKGDFPEELKDTFLGEQGLFPEPKEISFQCSCPDWALMCKHVAAVLYGIAARFDENPLLFFELRGIDVGRLVDVTIASHVDRMLENVDRPSNRILENGQWEKVFGL
jgi:uncharacterized Zn finger protein